MRGDRMPSLARETARRGRAILKHLYREIPFLRGSRKSKLIAAVRPYTVMSYAKLSAVYELTSHLESTQPEGAFVECGVLNGGCAGLIASVARGNKARQIWLFDSWEGLPEPTEFDVNARGETPQKGEKRGSLDTVRWLLFSQLRLDERKIHLVKGWFSESIPAMKHAVGPIAFLHLDCNFYESYGVCLEELYDSVVPGGIVFIDDYGSYRGSRKATDEFIHTRQLEVQLERVWTRDRRGYVAVYFRKGERRLDPPD